MQTCGIYYAHVFLGFMHSPHYSLQLANTRANIIRIKALCLRQSLPMWSKTLQLDHESKTWHWRAVAATRKSKCTNKLRAVTIAQQRTWSFGFRRNICFFCLMLIELSAVYAFTKASPSSCSLCALSIDLNTGTAKMN